MPTTRRIRAELASLDQQMAPALSEIAILAARSADARTDWPPGEAKHGGSYWYFLACEALKDQPPCGLGSIHRAAVALAWSRAGEEER